MPLTSKLIADNGLSGTGVSKEIFQRMKTDWDLAVYSVDPQSAAAVGTSIERLPEPRLGLRLTSSAAGLTMGLSTLVGGLIEP